MAEYGCRQSMQPMSILNQLLEDLKAIFLTETKCKIRFRYVRFDSKRKKWGKKWIEISVIKGGWGWGGLGWGGGRCRLLIANAIKNFHFVF